jgi:hypothetical protein
MSEKYINYKFIGECIMKKLVTFIITGLLTCGLTSCTTKDSQQIVPDISTSEVSLSTTSANEPSISIKTSDESLQNSLKAYNDVLQNKAKFNTTFYAEDATKTLFLNQLLSSGSETFRILNFSVLDMDGDGTPEVVMQYCLSADCPYPDYVEVLHYNNGTIYGYNFSYRGLYGLKDDGTFCWSNGSDDNGCAKLRFTSNAYEYDNLGYTKPNVPTSYFVNNQPVNESEYNDFINNQDNKKDVTWLDFTDENIHNQLSAN